MNKFLGFFKDNFLLIIIILLAIFVRIYRPQDFYIYGHDGDLASWIIKDILVNKHIRLVGQETSVKGVFIGPLFYYSLIPFYLFSKMDPIGGVLLSFLIGVFCVFSFYFVFSRIVNYLIH